jgi:hypothetical protein
MFDSVRKVLSKGRWEERLNLGDEEETELIQDILQALIDDLDYKGPPLLDENERDCSNCGEKGPFTYTRFCWSCLKEEI